MLLLKIWLKFEASSSKICVSGSKWKLTAPNTFGLKSWQHRCNSGGSLIHCPSQKTFPWPIQPEFLFPRKINQESFNTTSSLFCYLSSYLLSYLKVNQNIPSSHKADIRLCASEIFNWSKSITRSIKTWVIWVHKMNLRTSLISPSFFSKSSNHVIAVE